MKDIRFYINLYIIIPLIFAGSTTLASLLTYRLTRHYIDRHLPPEWPVAFWSMILVIFTLVCGILTVRFLIDPMQRFMVKTQTMGVLRDIDDESKTSPNSTELHKYTRVFDQVSEILSKVEARELFPDIIGQSKSMRAVFNQILKVAPTDSTVLISGETGTGKELVANAIHKHSRRQNKPFIAINCAAIPEGLLESELFGHEKGAFTGADAAKPGKFELAHEGTLFLDEIGDMPLETQAKVLRTLEERQIQRVGGVSTTKVDVRFIAATNKALPEAVQKGAFRQDLFFRLNVFAIHLPRLLERREDIPLLTDHFLQLNTPSKTLSSNAMQLLMSYEWPGNVRELQNTIKSGALMAAQDVIDAIHLPVFITQTNSMPSIQLPDSAQNGVVFQDLDQDLEAVEKRMILHALHQSRGIQKEAARLLGIKERSLWHRLKKFNIDASAYKSQ
jgi:transcriptional regulator with PAS, ATPase and Fis domain